MSGAVVEREPLEIALAEHRVYSKLNHVISRDLKPFFNTEATENTEKMTPRPLC